MSNYLNFKILRTLTSCEKRRVRAKQEERTYRNAPWLPELDDSVDGRTFDAERALGQGDGQRVVEREHRFAWLIYAWLGIQL